MNDPVQQLYERRVYPAMSHPVSDPMITSVAAMMAGLEASPPARSRILEIGCSSGLNLLALAARWPESVCVGLDLSPTSISQARELAMAAGIENAKFHAVDLRGFEDDGEGFDFIIAHGFLSWVPDEVKAALFAFCRKHLAPNGIATISFNVESGWRARFPVIGKVRAIVQAGAENEMTALAILKSVTETDSHEMAIIDDMLAKGPDILVFDDFGPVNDPWSLKRFVHAASRDGLRWLGESDPGGNFPACLDGEVLEKIQIESSDPFSFQMAADEAAGRTFHSCMVCRDDAPLSDRVPLKRWLEIAVRLAEGADGFLHQGLCETIRSLRSGSVLMAEVLDAMPDFSKTDLMREMIEGIQRGWLLAGIESVGFTAEPGDFPKLPPLRLECARRGLPLVDVWHRPCSFPDGHYGILSAMDGTRCLAALQTQAKQACPELAFDSWIRHLAGRGMFS